MKKLIVPWVWFRVRMVGRNFCRRCGEALGSSSSVWLVQPESSFKRTVPSKVARAKQPEGPFCGCCKQAVSLYLDIAVA